MNLSERLEQRAVDALERDASGGRHWHEHLMLGEDKKGNAIILPRLANVVAILSYDTTWVGVIAFNLFLEGIVATRIPPWDTMDCPADPAAGEWTDADTSRAVNWLGRHYGVHVSTRLVESALPVIAERTKFHPVREWLEELTWDRSPRADGLFVRYFGAEDTAYNRGVSARFMIGAVARVMQPGCKVDCTPVLEGPQGIGKSTGVRKLAGDEFFFDTPITMGDKDGYQALRGKWIGELGELSSLSRSDLNRAKNFLTATFDHYRPSFGRRARDFLRQQVFVGTTNATEYLRDETGNRRFWPVRCTRVDLAALGRDRDQLWAEAFARFTAGERWHVDSVDFAQQCEVEQAARFVADAWEAPVDEWIGSPGHPQRRDSGVTTGEVLSGALGMATEKWTKADQDRVAAVLRRLGWERGRQARGGDGKRERRWHPKSAEPLVTLVTGDRSGGLVTPVTDAVTPPVTRESGFQSSMSPASPANTEEERRTQSQTSAAGTVQPPAHRGEHSETRGDAGDVVTAPFADWVDGQLGEVAQ